MATKYFCVSIFRRLTMRRAFSVLALFCVVCLLLHMWFYREQDIQSQDLESNQHLRLFATIHDSLTNTSSLVKIANKNTYMLSAIIPFETCCSTYPAVIVNVFDAHDDTLYCCILQDGGRISVTKSSTLRRYQTYLYLSFLLEYFDPVPYPAKQITCPLVSSQGGATHLSLSSSTCSTNSDQYKPIVHAKDHSEQLAVCAKIAYMDALVPSWLVEWMEFQKLMGVDRIVVFTLQISENVKEVFDFYVKQGLLVTVPYGLAASGDLRRSMRRGNRSYPQFSHDEELAIFDCRERLSGYGYVAAIDLDEIIIPRSEQTLKELLKNSLSSRFLDAGAYFFYQQYHITNWEPSHPNNSLTSTRYMETTQPRWESQKFVYIPRRTEYARTHEVFVKSSFRTYTISPEVAVIHHFRVCPKTWKDCHTMSRILDKSTLPYQEQLDHNVRSVMFHLHKNR